MTALTPGGKATVSGNSYPRHPFAPGTIVTLYGQASNGRWYVFGDHPNPSLRPRVYYAYIAEADLTPHESDEAPADEPIYSEAQAAALIAEEKWEAAVVPDPVQVLGDHYRLATDEDIERALRNLRFEQATRKKEAVS